MNRCSKRQKQQKLTWAFHKRFVNAGLLKEKGRRIVLLMPLGA